MITPDDIKQKSLKMWQQNKIQRAYLCDESIFPMTFNCKPPSARQLSENYAQLRDQTALLHQHSKCIKNRGYRVEYRDVTFNKLGTQRLPNRIYFDTEADFLHYCGHEKTFSQFKKTVAIILEHQPALLEILQQKPELVLTYRNQWPRLLNVCDYFQRYPKPDIYTRQLPIVDVDSKFIESHRKVLDSLLTHLLPSESINQEITKLSAHGFEMRYGLKFDQPIIRFRLLDSQKLNGYPADDLAIPLSSFRNLNPSCQNIFITENKINGLCFPARANSIVIFGLGYGIQSLKNIDWLKEKSIYYWGDIDTHGFAILSQLRQYYPQTISMMMDIQTLMANRHMWVQEPKATRCSLVLANLNSPEQQVYQALINNEFSEHIRLEQERIAYKDINYAAAIFGVRHHKVEQFKVL